MDRGRQGRQGSSAEIGQLLLPSLYLQQTGRCMNDAASPQTFFDTNSLIYFGQFQSLLPMKNLLKTICIKLPMYLDTVMNQLIEKQTM